ncbi:hypothetical protein KP509_33G017100 [Ceratopteris richardii]|uniref:Uncharacterized protein n=1 Tax=Ceratopteris richardii TaxID=49495 RepID=A0A8T2QNI0_CERRI|nr:hypothetical protein KP509_33G017100 [Ceratopteris richardii]
MQDAAKDYAAGAAAGVATVIVGHPFDTVKVKLQTQHTEVNTTKYKNAADCILRILKTEGPKGFYKGASSSFVGFALESSVLFGAYSQMRTALQGREAGKPELSSIIPAAVVAGSCISMILCPTELVKCRLQVQSSADGVSYLSMKRYAGPLDCLQKTIKSTGIQGLFTGGFSTLLRECIGNAVFFTTYEFSRYRILMAIENPDMSESRSTKPDTSSFSCGKTHSNIMIEGAVDIMSGGLAGMTFWAIVLPFDVVKTRIQTAMNPRSNRNPFQNMKMIYKELGLRGLYAGLGPTLLRAFPANATAMVTWELTAKLLGVRRKEKEVPV